MSTRACSIVSAVAIVLLIAVPAFTQECGDLDGSGQVVATDALLLLNKAVGQPVPDLTCPLTVGVLATGQTKCFDLSVPLGAYIDCAGTGQDGEFQAGVARSFVDNGDGTVTDNATGLIWEKLSDDDTIHDRDNAYTWENAFAVKVPALNSPAFAGYTDWRVPNAFELFTLVDHAALSPHVDAVFDTACAPACTVLTCSCSVGADGLAGYWSSTSFDGTFGSLGAYFVDFFGGSVETREHSLTFTVRAVRGGS
jgi:hypothetical protein